MNQLRLALNIIIVVFFMLGRLQGIAEAAPPTKDLQVVGWVERVSLFPGNLKIKAKLDTGARNSSLNATQIEKFQRDGENWIRFELKNWKGRKENIEARVIRMAKIKQHGTEAATRPVVRLGICVGNVYKEVEVNLEDRNKFNYQMLIGRSYLKNSFAVDSSATYTVEPGCRSNADQ